MKHKSNYCSGQNYLICSNLLNFFYWSFIYVSIFLDVINSIFWFPILQFVDVLNFNTLFCSTLNFAKSKLYWNNDLSFKKQIDKIIDDTFLVVSVNLSNFLELVLDRIWLFNVFSGKDISEFDTLLSALMSYTSSIIYNLQIV